MIRRLSMLAAIACCELPGVLAASPAWRVTDYSMTQRVRDTGPHILLIYDMEGLAGQTDIRSSEPEQAEYAQGRRLLTDDVNAVIRGLFEGGAKAVSVADGHGGGMIDVLTDQLDPRAKMVTGSASDVYAAKTDPAAPDAFVAVGMHARSGSGGFWAHTYTWGFSVALNGQPVSEAELLAMAYGEIGVPLIMVSGDDMLGAGLRPMSWVQYATVKRSSGPAATVAIPLPEARRALTEAARRAVEKLPAARIVRVAAPVSVTAAAVAPWSLSSLGDLPGIDYRDNAVRFVATDFPSAYRGIKGVSAALIYTYYDAMEQAIARLPNRRELELHLANEYNRLWLQAETGPAPGKE